MPISTTGAGGLGGWTPVSMPSLGPWFPTGPSAFFTDAGLSAPCGDGDLIYTWKNFGVGGNFVQATSGARLTARLVGGRWVATSDGIGKYMDAPGVIAAIQTWYVAINRVSTTGNTSGISTVLSDSGGDIFNVRTNSATTYRSFVNGSGQNGADSGDHSHSTGNFRINGADGGTYAIGTPHYLVSKRTPTPQAYGGLRIARVGAAGARWFDGDYYAIFGTTDWSLDDQTASEAYLAARIA